MSTVFLNSSTSGGVDVPFHVGADAHSDGDAMYHR